MCFESSERRMTFAQSGYRKVLESEDGLDSNLGNVMRDINCARLNSSSSITASIDGCNQLKPKCGTAGLDMMNNWS